MKELFTIMEIFWATIVTIILGLIIYGVINQNISKRKAASVSIGDIKLRKIDQIFNPANRYNVVINNGTKFENVKILGFFDTVGSSGFEYIFPSRRWLILEEIDETKIFINPYRIMWMKEAEKNATPINEA